MCSQWRNKQIKTYHIAFLIILGLKNLFTGECLCRTWVHCLQSPFACSIPHFINTHWSLKTWTKCHLLSGKALPQAYWFPALTSSPCCRSDDSITHTITIIFIVNFLLDVDLLRKFRLNSEFSSLLQAPGNGLDFKCIWDRPDGGEPQARLPTQKPLEQLSHRQSTRPNHGWVN